jgi:RNA polymerase sigma-70 factor (ECF subfamily)
MPGGLRPDIAFDGRATLGEGARSWYGPTFTFAESHGKQIGRLMRRKGVSQEQADFAEFYAGSRDDCLRTVLATVRDVDKAQDLVAEAFARAWASWPRVSRHPAPRAWVVRTALNLSVSSWRRHRRELPLMDHDAPACGPASIRVDTELAAVLQRLPARQRQVVALRIFLDLDTAQTAEVLGIAPGTVTAHLTRALAALRTEFAAHAREGDPS